MDNLKFAKIGVDSSTNFNVGSFHASEDIVSPYYHPVTIDPSEVEEAWGTLAENLAFSKIANILGAIDHSLLEKIKKDVALMQIQESVDLAQEK